MMLKRLTRAVALAAAAALLTACSASPEATVKNFYRAVEKKDDDAALKLIHPGALQMMGVSKFQAAFTQLRTKFEKCGGVKDVEVTLNGTDEHKSGYAKISFSGNCPPQRDNLSMSKADGTWRIGGM